MSVLANVRCNGCGQQAHMVNDSLDAVRASFLQWEAAGAHQKHGSTSAGYSYAPEQITLFGGRE